MEERAALFDAPHMKASREGRVPGAKHGGAGPATRRGPDPRTVLVIASLGASVAVIDATIVNIAFPSIRESFPSASISSLSWVLNAYNIVFAAFLVAAGRLADMLGRRRLFIFGLELFTAASLLCAVAPSVGALVAFRVIQGLGAALVLPTSLALVLHAFPRERRAHGIAMLSAISAAAAGLGPSIGGVLVAADDWRLVFLVNLPIGVAGVMLARSRLIESRTPGRRRIPDIVGAIVFALAIAALVLGIVKGEEWGWGSARVVSAFAAAAVLSAVFVWRCTWHRAPVIDLSLLRLRTFSAANGMTVVAAAGFYSYTLANVLFLTGVWRYSVLQAGLALTPGPFVAAAVARPTARLAERFGHRPVLVAGGLIWGGAIMWLVERVGPTPAFVDQWLPGIVLLGIGAGTLFPNISSAAVASAPGERFATATGLNSVARQVGAAIGVAVVVAIIGRPTALEAPAAFDDAWTFGAACMFVAALGCLLVGRITSEDIGSQAVVSRGERHRSGVAVSGVERARARRAVKLQEGAHEHQEGAHEHSARAESASDFLARVPLFSQLDESLRASVAERVRELRVDAGEWLFRAGDPGEAMFIVSTGRLEVVDEATGAVIRELGRGDAVGELALLSGSPRSASVRAARASDLLAVDRSDFDELAQSTLALSLSLNRVLAEQLRSSRSPTSQTRPLPATVALVSLDEGAPCADVARRLTAALESHVSALLLDDRVASSNGAPSALATLLDRAEAEHDVVVLDAGHLWTGGPWTELCLQQADRILAMTSGAPVPGLLAERAELRGCDLVACDVAEGSGKLQAWVEQLDPIESHAVRSASMGSDIERMARRLSGHSLGIVLSGGGARAFAHIGVLEELTAAGVAIDRVAGVSMGAFVGALFAMGLAGDEIDARCFEEWVQRRPIGDYTIPRRSLIRGTRVEAMLRRTFADTAIEELALSYMCGCTELRSGRLLMMRSGPLWERVGYSMCVPVLAVPRVRGRDLLVDGSLVDNLPVSALADLGEGPIIAVDVKATFDGGEPPPVPGERPPAHRVAAAADHSRAPARTAAAAGQQPPDRRPPSMGETLTRVLLLGSSNTSEEARRHADVVIKPRPDGVGLLEFHQIDAAREAGRVAAREALETGLPAVLG